MFKSWWDQGVQQFTKVIDYTSDPGSPGDCTYTVGQSSGTYNDGYYLPALGTWGTAETYYWKIRGCDEGECGSWLWNGNGISDYEKPAFQTVEMVHDARVIRINGQHKPGNIKQWMGDSIGRWDGDTLVIDTTNFNDTPALFGANRDLHVVERFSRKPDGTLLYAFTVENPGVWLQPWSGEYPWPATTERVFEYACHEANYALGNVLRGARLLDAEALAGKTKSTVEGETP